MPCAERGPRGGTEPVDRREHRGLVAGRRLDGEPRVAERDDADHDARRPAVDDRLARRPWPPPSGSGSTSSAAMLPDTSNMSISVPSSRGRATVACGRASATIGRRTRRPRAPPAAGRGAGGPARGARRGRRRSVPDSAVSAATPAPPAIGDPPATSTPSGTRSEQQRAAARGTSAGHRRRRSPLGRQPDDRAHEVVVGRERTASTPAAANDRLDAASRARPPPPRTAPGTRVAGVDLQLLAGLGVLHEHRPDVRQLRSRGSTSRTASSSWRWLSRWSWRSQPGVADEVGHDDHERPAADLLTPASSSGAEVRGRRASASASAARSSSSVEAQDRDPAGRRPGSCARRSPPYEDRPDPVAAAGEDPGERRRRSRRAPSA